ncbi:MAG: porphobilinogen synthase, partial [Myxococcales bacterium]|nr:porphobilinogen synthase [Myxococcales bacterium]
MALQLTARPRRNRKSPWVRAMARETWLGPEHFIYPLFMHEDAGTAAIASMPGCLRHDLTSLVAEVEAAQADGIGAVVLFPKVPEALKTNDGAEAYNPEGLVPRAIKAIKARCPDMTVITDVALDPYSSKGHDGIVSDDGRVLNDETVEVLVKQALSHARAGADVISPSDMMDGRVG